MTKRVYWGCVIGTALILYAIVGGFGESAIAKPMVECNAGVCQISEADWERYREYAKAQRESMDRMESAVMDYQRALERFLGELAKRNARTPQKEV